MMVGGIRVVPGGHTDRPSHIAEFSEMRLIFASASIARAATGCPPYLTHSAE